MEQGPDGAIYVADDYSGTIYRVATDGRTGGGEFAVPGPAPVETADWSLPDDWKELGEALYDEKACASCHEIQPGEDRPLVKSLDGLGARFGAAGIAALLETPPGNMPDPELDEEQRRVLARWLAHKYP